MGRVLPVAPHSKRTTVTIAAMLDSRNALVTGGAAGMGRAIAERLVADGAAVVIADRDSEAGRATAEALGVLFLEHDVRLEESWTDVVTAFARQCGPLHILVNNAGLLSGPVGAVDPVTTSLEDWRRIFATNVEGVFLGCRAAIPAIAGSGSGGAIVNIASIAGLMATPFAVAYGASKAAVGHLTKSVAQYCAANHPDIRCNSVHPGMVRTPNYDNSVREEAAAGGRTFEDIIAGQQALVPLGAFVPAEDVAAAVSFLVSEHGRYITGAEFVIDGGVINCDTFHWR
jgi:NAD(P)-dependent dehydrogenase (short-subunit alcohol dehydrogenase family)